MKKLFMFVCVFCLAYAAFAEEDERHNEANSGEGTRRGAIFFGRAAPVTGWLADYFKPGYFGGISEKFETRGSGVDYDIGADIDFGAFTLEEDEDYGVLMLGLDVFSRFYPSSLHIPYLSVSAGLITFFGDEDGMYAFKLSGGGGVEIPLGANVSVAIDAKYTIAFNFGGAVTYWPIRLELVVPFSILDFLAKD